MNAAVVEDVPNGGSDRRKVAGSLDENVDGRDYLRFG